MLFKEDDHFWAWCLKKTTEFDRFAERTQALRRRTN